MHALITRQIMPENMLSSPNNVKQQVNCHLSSYLFLHISCDQLQWPCRWCSDRFESQNLDIQLPYNFFCKALHSLYSSNKHLILESVRYYLRCQLFHMQNKNSLYSSGKVSRVQYPSLPVHTSAVRDWSLFLMLLDLSKQESFRIFF